MIDLHMHSTFSDGSLTPEQLVARGVGLGLKALALTDHDSTNGVGRFLEACRVQGMIGVSGVELSVNVDKGTMHMLGYHVTPGTAELEGLLVKIREGRRLRNEEILARLQKLGCALTWEEVQAYAGEDVVGRPHFAQALQARGYISKKDEAFEKYLGKGKPAYVERFRLSPEQGIAAIRGAGGVPVLSHAFTLQLSSEELRRKVREWKAMGLEGLEVYYSEHSAELVEEYLRLCAEFDLIATGGSDFHGVVNPDIEMGRGFGSLRVPDEVLDALQARRARVVGGHRS